MTEYANCIAPIRALQINLPSPPKRKRKGGSELLFLPSCTSKKVEHKSWNNWTLDSVFISSPSLIHALQQYYQLVGLRGQTGQPSVGLCFCLSTAPEKFIQNYVGLLYELTVSYSKLMWGHFGENLFLNPHYHLSLKCRILAIVKQISSHFL